MRDFLLPKRYFIGAGLSAFFTQLMFWREGDICIYPNINSSPYRVRRSFLETNKAFSYKSKSYGSCEYIIDKKTLHDRNTLGGNSEIWGGFFDISEVQNPEKLLNAGVKLVPLSYKATGSVSNVKNIVQLQEPNGRILNAANYLKPGEFKYLDKIYLQPTQISLKWTDGFNSWDSTVDLTTKIFICVGVVQTIDLLIRSNIIKEGDKLTLDEFEYSLNYGKNKIKLCKKKCTIISYSPSRAFAHLLGVQKNILSIGQELFTINQFFYPKKHTLELEYYFHNKSNSPYIKSNRMPHNFGRSIHYCNLKINGERLTEMMKRFNPNLYFVGMASVSQSKPGPISSDIFKQIENISNEF